MTDDLQRRTSQGTAMVTMTAEMYEELRKHGKYSGEDALGRPVSITDDRQTIGPKEIPEMGSQDAWGPLFTGVKDGSELDKTEPVANYRTKTALLEATTGDELIITEIHEGARHIPEEFEVSSRTNTFYGPTLDVRPTDNHDREQHGWEITCPGPQSHAILWKPVVDDEGHIQTRVKLAKVSLRIYNVAGYDLCPDCGEPIKDPMHRSVSMLGQCPGDWDAE